MLHITFLMISGSVIPEKNQRRYSCLHPEFLNWLSVDSPSFLMRSPRAQYVDVDSKKPTTDDLIQVLEDVRLGYLLSRFEGLDSMHEWSSVLSLGEQQRLAFARLLLSKPYLVLLDESTSALDEANEVINA